MTDLGDSARGDSAQGDAERIDTSDMLAVHGALRDTLALARARVTAVAPDDEARVELISNYYDNILHFLEDHHNGEEELVFPLLRERCAEAGPLIDSMVEQHHEVVHLMQDSAESLAAWSAGDSDAQFAAAERLDSLHIAMLPHLDQEEAEVLPLAERYMSPAEWGQLPGHAMAAFAGDKIWLVLGLIIERRTPEQVDVMLSHMPPPAVQMWTNMGEQAFKELSAAVG